MATASLRTMAAPVARSWPPRTPPRRCIYSLRSPATTQRHASAPGPGSAHRSPELAAPRKSRMGHGHRRIIPYGIRLWYTILHHSHFIT
jgi:hypothetical protein